MKDQEQRRVVAFYKNSYRGFLPLHPPFQQVVTRPRVKQPPPLGVLLSRFLAPSLMCGSVLVTALFVFQVGVSQVEPQWNLSSPSLLKSSFQRIWRFS